MSKNFAVGKGKISEINPYKQSNLQLFIKFFLWSNNTNRPLDPQLTLIHPRKIYVFAVYIDVKNVFV